MMKASHADLARPDLLGEGVTMVRRSGGVN